MCRYVGDDVSPDFYGWVFPKYDHVAVGTGTVVNKTAIKQYQQVGGSCSCRQHREQRRQLHREHSTPTGWAVEGPPLLGSYTPCTQRALQKQSP